MDLGHKVTESGAQPGWYLLNRTSLAAEQAGDAVIGSIPTGGRWAHAVPELCSALLPGTIRIAVTNQTFSDAELWHRTVER